MRGACRVNRRVVCCCNWYACTRQRDAPCVQGLIRSEKGGPRNYFCEQATCEATRLSNVPRRLSVCIFVSSCTSPVVTSWSSSGEPLAMAFEDPVRCHVTAHKYNDSQVSWTRCQICSSPSVVCDGCVQLHLFTPSQNCWLVARRRAGNR